MKFSEPKVLKVQYDLNRILVKEFKKINTLNKKTTFLIMNRILSLL